MKTRGIGQRRRMLEKHVAPRSSGPTRPAPATLHTRVSGEPAMCERCGAVYQRKTWRGGERTRRTSLVGVGWTLCPACAQILGQEYFGRVLVEGAPGPARELEIRRRIRNVEARARYTQPERRTVRIDRTPRGLEILTTSQKLAHRITRELEKAFGGTTRFVWNDHEAAILEATWIAPAEPERHAPLAPRRPRLKRRSLPAPR